MQHFVGVLSTVACSPAWFPVVTLASSQRSTGKLLFEPTAAEYSRVTNDPCNEMTKPNITRSQEEEQRHTLRKQEDRSDNEQKGKCLKTQKTT